MKRQDADAEREVRVRVEREHANREARDRAEAQEREIRVRVERDQDAVNSWVEEIANAQSAEAHEHAARAYEEAMKLHGHADSLHKDSAELHKRYLKLNDVHLDKLAELQHLDVELTDLQDAWAVQVGDLAKLDLLATDLEGIDLTKMGIDLAAIEGADVQAFAFAMPGGEKRPGVWSMAPHDGQHQDMQRFILRTQEACECDCEGECEECEECCTSEDVHREAMALFSAVVPHGEHAPKNLFVPGAHQDLERNLQVFVAPEGHEGMNWTTDGNASFGWTTTGPGEHNVFEWSTDANPFQHEENVELHGEHEVRILRSGESGQIIIHGGDGEQHIYIHGHAGSECNADHDAHKHEDHEETIHFGHAVPQPPRAPQAPRAMLRLPSPQPSPRIRLQNHEGHEIRGRVIIDGETIEYTTKDNGNGVADVLFAPRDASAPAPARVKDKKKEAEQLIQEMRAEMEALRQELSDLRRQMKDDPLVRAQHDARLEDVRLWRASMTPVADRKRAGLGSR